MAQAFLVLADGTVFKGTALGTQGTSFGEVVFTTGMTGYQETLTDPSYYGQMVCQTFPLMGNYGTNCADNESAKSQVKGYIVRESCPTPSNFRCRQTLDAFLKQQGIVGIQGLDTRALTRRLRSAGVMNGAIVPALPDDLPALLHRIRNFCITGAVAAVSCQTPQVFEATGQQRYTIALYDYGCKAGIIAQLQKRGCRVHVLPHNTPAAVVQGLKVDGIMLSNGPGDPAENLTAIQILQQLCGLGLPMFGICLGHQLMALAMGAATYKLPFGHRGANQPVTDLARARTFITTQNHGYAVDAASLPAGVGAVSHVNANDGSLEGISYTGLDAFTVQFHPEACAGPQDTAYLFDQFIARLQAKKEGAPHAAAQ